MKNKGGGLRPSYLDSFGRKSALILCHDRSIDRLHWCYSKCLFYFAFIGKMSQRRRYKTYVCYNLSQIRTNVRVLEIISFNVKEWGHVMMLVMFKNKMKLPKLGLLTDKPARWAATRICISPVCLSASKLWNWFAFCTIRECCSSPSMAHYFSALYFRGALESREWCNAPRLWWQGPAKTVQSKNKL